MYERCVLRCKQNHLQLNLIKQTTVDQLRSFNMCRVTPCWGQCVLDAVTCWSSRLRVADASTLNALIHKAGDAVGVEPDSLKVLLKRWMLSKMRRCWKVSPTHSVTRWPVTGAAHLVLLFRSLMLLSHSRPTGVHIVQYDRSMCAVWCDFNEHNIYVKYPTVVHWHRDAPPFKCYLVWTKSPTVSWDAVCRPCKHSMSSPLLQQVSQLVLQVFRVLHTGGQRNRTKLTAEKCSSCFSEA